MTRVARRALAAALLAAGASASVGCGGAQRPAGAAPDARAWYDRAALAPAPGRVPLRVESPGAPQQIGLRREAAAPSAPSSPLAREAPRVPLCVTPCTVYVPPDAPVVLHTGGLGVRPYATRVTPGVRGQRLRLRAPRERDATAANAAATGGVLLELLGVIFLVAGPIEIATGSSSGIATTILGGALLGVGVAFWVPGWLALRRLEPGVAERAPIAVGPGGLRVRF